MSPRVADRRRKRCGHRPSSIHLLGDVGVVKRKMKRDTLQFYLPCGVRRDHMEGKGSISSTLNRSEARLAADSQTHATRFAPAELKVMHFSQ
jgi:hypothetical protein